MKLLPLATLLIGLAIGYFASHKMDQAKLTETTEETQKTKTSVSQEDQKSDVAAAQNLKTPDMKTSSETSTTSTTQVDSSTKPGEISKMKSQDMLMCLDQMKPSDMLEWETNWNKKVTEFISTNDSFWNSRGSHSFDSRVVPSLVGKYKGTWYVANNKKTKIYLTLEIKSETQAIVQMEITENGSNPELGASSNCSSDTSTRKDFGIDEQRNALNVFMMNCNPSILGPAYSRFAFKLPIGLQKGQQNSTDVFGLNENFAWVSEGNLDLKKL